MPSPSALSTAPSPAVSGWKKASSIRNTKNCPINNTPLKKYGILFFGCAESAVGLATLLAILHEIVVRGASSKPGNVLAFVITSSCVSLSLGIGVLLRRHYARKFLVFFAGWVILSKILIAMGIISLCCALETRVPPNIKNAVSVVYHAIIMFFFHHPSIKKEFER